MLAAAPAGAEVVDDDPAIAAQGIGDMRLFVRGRDGALWTRSWNGSTWSDWSSLGGQLTSGPAAMTRPGGVYDVFVRGGDNAIHHIYFTPGGGWSGWASLGGGFTSGPGATFRQGSGNVDVFGVGLDKQLFHNSWAPGSGAWSGWVALGGGINGAPSAISPAADTLDVYVRGADNQLYQKYWTPSSGWVEYIPHGGQLISAPEATAWDTNRRDIFARGGDGAIYSLSWNGSWFDWARQPGTAFSGPGATSLGPGRLQVFAGGGPGLIAKSYAGSWTDWQNFSEIPPAPPVAAPPPTPAPPSLAELRLRAGFGCIPQGGRVPVRVRVLQRTNRLKPRVIKVVFFIDRGKRRRVDRHKPYKTRIRVTFKRGSKHRVHARIYFRRQGSKTVHRKTVSKRFTMCK